MNSTLCTFDRENHRRRLIIFLLSQVFRLSSFLPSHCSSLHFLCPFPAAKPNRRDKLPSESSRPKTHLSVFNISLASILKDSAKITVWVRVSSFIFLRTVASTAPVPRIRRPWCQVHLTKVYIVTTMNVHNYIADFQH